MNVDPSELIDIVTMAAASVDRLLVLADFSNDERARLLAERERMMALLDCLQEPVALEPGQTAALHQAQLNLGDAENSVTGHAPSVFEATSTILGILGSMSFELPGDDPTKPKG